MRRKTFIVSALLHVVVFGVAMQAAKRSSARRATSVAVVGEKKKPKPQEEKPKPPKPKPAAKPQPVEAAPEPLKNAPTHVTETAHEAPVETNLEMSNDTGPGIAVGPPKGTAPKQGPAQAAGAAAAKGSAAKKEKAVGPKDDNPEEDTCTEAPTKPVPVQRTEIEYTQEARANNVEGRLVVRITVGADGSVLKVEVLQKLDPQLDAAVIAAVKGWVFKPSMRCGKPMAGGVYTMAKDFELSD
jgi:periplasmic protein TonB